MERTTLPRLLTAQEVAEDTGLAFWRVYDLARQDKIPHLRLGRSLRLGEAALTEWAEHGGPSPEEVVR